MTTAEQLAAEIERLFTLLVGRRGAVGETEPAPLTATQRVALALVVDRGPLRLGELADALRTTDPTATRTVDALEGLQLARRVPDETDRRATRVEATRRGHERVRRRRGVLVDLLREPLDELSASDQQRFVDLLAELNDVLAADAPSRRRISSPA